MTDREKQKAVDALKISAPVMAMTQEEFNDYIQTINQIMDWLEQEPCEDAISRETVLKIIDGWYEQNRDADNIEDLIVLITYMDSVNPQKPKSECEHDHEILKAYSDGASAVLDKIRAEILVLDDADYDFEGYYKAVTDALKIIDKYKAESEDKE